MKMRLSFHNQHGATLIVGLIMLAVITLTVTAAFTLNSTNLKSVGNMQFRNEAMAAANKAIEQVLSSPFTTSPSADEINVDINNDGTFDYVVQVAAPVCVRASTVTTSTAEGGGCSSDLNLSCDTPAPLYHTVWDIQATVTEVTSGTSVKVHQGVRAAPIDATQLSVVCP